MNRLKKSHLDISTMPKPSLSRPHRFEGKVVAVTGSARGIGKNIAAAFGREGAVLAICDVDSESGLATVSEFRQQGIAAEFLRVDLSRRGQPRAMVRRVAKRLGRLDVLVNNARSGRRNGSSAEDEESWELGVAVTLRAAFFASQEAVGIMEACGGGAIVNISSTTAILAAYNVSPTYQICKAGMMQMTRYFATHAGSKKVRVNAVLPGFIVQDEHRGRFERSGNRRYRKIASFVTRSDRQGHRMMWPTHARFCVHLMRRSLPGNVWLLMAGWEAKSISACCSNTMGKVSDRMTRSWTAGIGCEQACGVFCREAVLW